MYREEFIYYTTRLPVSSWWSNTTTNPGVLDLSGSVADMGHNDITNLSILYIFFFVSIYTLKIQGKSNNKIARIYFDPEGSI